MSPQMFASSELSITDGTVVWLGTVVGTVCHSVRRRRRRCWLLLLFVVGDIPTDLLADERWGWSLCG
jgi:hypothetical protein